MTLKIHNLELKYNEAQGKLKEEETELSADSTRARKAINKSKKDNKTRDKINTNNARANNAEKAVPRPPPVIIDNVNSLPVLKQVLEDGKVNPGTY